MNNSSSDNIKNKNPIWKKVICVGDKPPTIVVVIDESIVKRLDIDEKCWFEEIPTIDGVVLKLSRCLESSSITQGSGRELNCRTIPYENSKSRMIYGN